MKKILKKEVIIAFIIGIILASSIAVYATYTYSSKDVGYTKPGTTQEISVEAALNYLYSKSNKTPQQVATLTTQDASYTFQNDGYITGTVGPTYNTGGGIVYFNSNNPETDENTRVLAPWNDNRAWECSIFVPKGTAVFTRKNYGTYNLTCYEFK